MRKTGAFYKGGGRCLFEVWAPSVERISLNMVSEKQGILPMRKDREGYFSVTAEGISPGDRYFYRLNGKVDRPDPASNFQPEGVFGPSSIVDHAAFKWKMSERVSLPPEEMIIYELHVGTFSGEGTFYGAAAKLPYLTELGINTVEIMPVAQFPGDRNWGYDGVYPFAVQNSYGGPEGLKDFVEKCHALGISVILDVVYNHLGPEGNFLPEFMPCFTERYTTPWGKAINFDDSYSYGVRDFFIRNALYWFEHYQIDALRLDAIHGIFDMSAKHFLRELSEAVAEFCRDSGSTHYLIAESDLNDTRVIKKYDRGGYGIDAQWNDDFHHSVHAVLTGESAGYYRDFGGVDKVAKALSSGFVYSWDFSEHRKRYHGMSSSDCPLSKFVVFSQNHDQVGNRAGGERLSLLTSTEGLKVSAASVLLSPSIPLLFMGEEYGENAPFLYFMSFTDNDLIEAVRQGRKKEFREFHSRGEPEDPYDVETFKKSKLRWEKVGEERHSVLLGFYKELIELRKNNTVIREPEKTDLRNSGDVIGITRQGKGYALHVVLNFGDQSMVSGPAGIPGTWSKIFDSSETKWLGPGTIMPDTFLSGENIPVGALSAAVYRNLQ